MSLNRASSITHSIFSENFSKVPKREENGKDAVLDGKESGSSYHTKYIQLISTHVDNMIEIVYLKESEGEDIHGKTSMLATHQAQYPQRTLTGIIAAYLEEFKRIYAVKCWISEHLEKLSGEIGVKTGKDETLKRSCFQPFYNRQEEERIAVPVLRIITIKGTIVKLSFGGFIESENEKVILLEISVLKKGDPTASDKADGVNTEEGKQDREGTSEIKDMLAANPEQKRNLCETVNSNTLVKEEKRLAGLKSTFRKVKGTERPKETCGKERLQTKSLSSHRAKIRWWAHNLALNFILSQITVIYLTIGLMAQTASASFSCAELQTAELGKLGTIVCTFPDSFHAVYWYDDVRDGSSPLITYTHRREDKTEFCMENENYDASENGSLIICDVAVSHEKNYTVIMYTNPSFYEQLTVSLKVVAFPGDRSTTVQCENCHEGRYHRINTNGSLSCSFKVARPAVFIEWVQRYSQGDSLIAVQEVNITNNANGTYSTSANVHLMAKSDKQIAVFVCRANYLSSEWKREREILLDFSQSESFSSVPISTSYMETRTRAEIRCGGSDHIIQIWKIILTTGESETIGFRFGNSTEMTKNVSGIEITSEGSLIFSAPQIQHEGVYACVYSDGVKDGMQRTRVVVLIAPSPPFIRITGCSDTEYNCVLKEEVFQELTCTVDGVYPNATLEWVSKNPSQVSFYNYSTLYEKHVQAYDISASVKPLFSPDLPCNDEIYIECHIHGPTSRVMKAERSARLTPKSCMVKTEEGDDQWTAFFLQLCVLEIVVVVQLVILIRCFVIRLRKSRVEYWKSRRLLLKGRIQTNGQTSRKGKNQKRGTKPLGVNRSISTLSLTGRIQTDMNGHTSSNGTKIKYRTTEEPDKKGKSSMLFLTGRIQTNDQTSRKGEKMKKVIKISRREEHLALTGSQYRQTIEQDSLLQEDDTSMV